MPDVRADQPRPLDWRGFLLVALSMAALVAGLESTAAQHPRRLLAIGLLVLAGAALSATTAYLLRSANPLVDLRIFRVRTYRATALGGSVFRATITAIPFLLPLLFQLGFGWTAAQAGLVVIALFAGNIGIKPATTPLMRRFGIRTVMLGSVIASAACLVGIAFLGAGTPLAVTLAVLLLSGVFRSTGFTTYNTVAYADVPPERIAGANALMSTMQELGAGLGVATGALLVRWGDSFTSEAASSFRFAFLVLAVLLMLPAIEAFRLPGNAGNVITGREV